MNKLFSPMVEIVPEGQIGNARVEHFEVTPDGEKWSRVRAAVTGGRERAIPAGKYAKLTIGSDSPWNEPMMSDTPFEHSTNLVAVLEARGDVLIAGLGLGMILVPILAKPEVKSVLVIEKSQDVIDLVLPALGAKLPRSSTSKVSVTCADIFEWPLPKGATWDAIYFDIWQNQSEDDLDEIAKLKRRYARRKRQGGWMGAWREAELRYMARKGR